MNELSNAKEMQLSQLQTLGKQAQMLQQSINFSLFQMGQVMKQARALCDDGAWLRWVQENTDFSARKAQQLIQICDRFGQDEAFAHLGRSTLIKMLSLPEGTEKQFAEENDLEAMTARQVEEAVRKVREEQQADYRRYEEEMKKAKVKMRELLDRPPEVLEDLKESLREKDEVIDRQWTELERLKVIGQEQLAEANKLRKENADLLRDVKDQANMLQEAQENYDQVQRELLDAKSAIARGEVDRMTSDRLTSDVFARAVRQFMGDVARMPHMRTAFVMMGAEEKAEFDELLSTVESWAVDARKALDTTAAEGVIL